MGNAWYAFYPGDYGRDTAHLSLVEDGAYRRLLDYCYSTGRPIPTHVEQVFRICRAFIPTEQEAVRSVLSQFFVEGPDGWHNQRVDREIIKSKEIIEKRSRAGKESARKRNATQPTHAEHVLTQPQPQPQETAPPLLKESDFVLEENARAREASERPNPSRKEYDPEVGLAIDLRKLGKAFEAIKLQRTASIGSGTSISEKEVFEWACELAGISVKRGREVQRLGREWPTQTELEASA